MAFIPVDMETYSRREHYEHYKNNVPCTYSMTANVDITGLKEKAAEKGVKFYPALIYVISKAVNRREEFRTCHDKNGMLGYYDVLHPTYTVFDKKSETFSSLWTQYDEDFHTFCKNVENDITAFTGRGFLPQKDAPENLLNISAIPWRSFTGFNLNLPLGHEFYLPIFTAGKYFTENGRTFIPLSVQVHHAVCDGFHVCRLLDDIENIVKTL